MRIVAIFLAALMLGACTERPNKINGICLEMPPDRIEHPQMLDLKRTNANWVAMIPYAFVRRNSTEVNFRMKGGWWGESYEGTIECIKLAQACGLKIMMKPHTWISGQGWAGDFKPELEQDWTKWEVSYREYILTYAYLADSMQVDLFCIGTEYRKAVVERPEYWKKLIADVKSVYKGPITYAANWDNYHLVPFWDQVDYIGVDAYFPLSKKPEPTLDELLLKWDSVNTHLAEWSEKYDKPILFTEYGYRSIEYANSGHWNYRDDTVRMSESVQATAYEALFRATWEQPWMAGGFFWKWHFPNERRNRSREKDYTPQQKEAEKVISAWYGKE